MKLKKFLESQLLVSITWFTPLIVFSVLGVIFRSRLLFVAGMCTTFFIMLLIMGLAINLILTDPEIIAERKQKEITQ